MNRRLIAAVAGVGALSFALVGGTAAGASTTHKAKPSTASPASITVSATANLKKGSVVTVSGSGWPTQKNKNSVIVVECDDDGDGPGATMGSCDLTALTVVKASSTGKFSTKFTIVTGSMATGKPDNDCPPTATQTEHAVECIIAAADLSTTPETFALALIHFSAPPLSFSFAKASPINGRPTYSMKITETGDYLGGAGGFEVIGAFGPDHNRLCQGSSNNSTTWTPPGLPACTIFFGEVVQINLNGVKVKLLRVDAVGSKTTSAGDFSWTLPHTPPGTHYTVEALGLVSGDELTQTTTVP